MADINIRFMVTFEDPFWIGIYECEQGAGYSVAKVTFGAEPKEGEIYEFILRRWQGLKISRSIETDLKPSKKINPKRMQREIKKQMSSKSIGTKAQQALKAQQGEGKVARKTYFKQQKEQEKERIFNLKQEKRKEKHKGH